MMGGKTSDVCDDAKYIIGIAARRVHCSYTDFCTRARRAGMDLGKSCMVELSPSKLRLQQNGRTYVSIDLPRM